MRPAEDPSALGGLIEFSNPKLPQNAAMILKRMPVKRVEPYTFVEAPVYVYFKRNQKFLAIKAPLDFFTEEELEKLEVLGTFYVPRFVDKLSPFYSAAGACYNAMTWTPPQAVDPRAAEYGDGYYPAIAMEMAPFELSDAVLRIIGPLWADGPVIEPFFVNVFISSLCGPMPKEDLLRGRDKGVDLYETAVLRSAWATFLAMHLGYVQFDTVKDLRLRAFREVLTGRLPSWGRGEISDIIRVAGETLPSPDSKMINGNVFMRRSDRVSLKFSDRLKRVTNEMVRQGSMPPSIYGANGFRNV